MFYYNYNTTFIIGKGALLCSAMLCYALLCYSTVTTLARFLGLSGLMFLSTER